MQRWWLNSRRMLLATAAGLAVASQLPSAWTAGLWRPPAHVLAAAVQPFAQPLKSFGDAVRDRTSPPSEELRVVQADRDALRRYNEELLQEIDALREQVRQLSQVRTSERLTGTQFPSARVTAGPSDPNNPTLTINRGSRDGLREGLVVAEGMHLVGRLGDVGPFTASVSLITRAGTHLKVNLSPAQAGPGSRRVPAVAEAKAGRGEFWAVLAVEDPVQVGDLAFLADDAWPEEARGFVVGRVESREQLPEDPTLRVRVVIRPIRSLPHLSRVIVAVPTEGLP